jgi:translation initiation factor 3 subunit H|eukprot:gene2316-1692_t
MSTEVQLVREVVIDAVTAMRIVKHCTDNGSTMVAGSLLGLDIDGVLQVTYSFPFPQPKGDDDTEEIDGAAYQMDMMKMLRDVNMDNNCVGWYQSINMGTICTNDVVSYQFNYQSAEDLSANSIVIFYDTTLSRRGDISLKAFRLSEKFMKMRKTNESKFIKPADILEELPVTIRTVGHASAFVRCLEDVSVKESDCTFDALDMSNTESYIEKHIETVCSWTDDILNQQGLFQSFARANSKSRQEQIRWLKRRLEDNLEKKQQGEPESSTDLVDSGIVIPELNGRNDHLLMLAQVDRYTQQLQSHVAASLQKVNLTTALNN